MFDYNYFYTKIRAIRLKKLRDNTFYNINESFEIDNITDEELKNKIFSNLDKLEEFKSFLSKDDMFKIAYLSASTYLSIWEFADFLKFVANPIYDFEHVSKLFADFLIIISEIKIGESIEVFDTIDKFIELFNRYKNRKDKDIDDVIK